MRHQFGWSKINPDVLQSEKQSFAADPSPGSKLYQETKAYPIPAYAKHDTKWRRGSGGDGGDDDGNADDNANANHDNQYHDNHQDDDDATAAAAAATTAGGDRLSSSSSHHPHSSHIVRSFAKLDVEPDVVHELLSLKLISDSYKKCLMGIAASLLRKNNTTAAVKNTNDDAKSAENRGRGGSGVVSRWVRGYFQSLGRTLGMNDEVLAAVEPLLDYDFDAQPFVCAIQAEDARWRQERRQQQQQQEEQEPKDKEPKMAKSVDVVKEVDDEDIKEDDDAKDAKIDDDVDLEYDDVDELVSHVERMRMEMIVVHYSLEMMGYYDSRTRCFIRDLCGATRLPWDLFGRYEDIYCETLRKAVLAAEEAKEKAKQSRGWKWAKVGLVAVAGGVATALTAGLAAPIVGASLVAIGGTSSAIAAAGAFLMTASGAVIFGGAVGAYSFRVIGYRADNRIADVKEFEFVPLSEKAQPDNEHGSMSAIICVSGWHLEQKKAREELEDLWKDRFVANFAPGKEVYGLQWETKELADFGNALTSALRDKALSYAAGKALAYSAVHTAIAAMATPALILEVSQLIDNKYVVALNRSDKAALILADALKSHVQGRRPVTLVGISMGARMLFKALEILAKEEQDSNNTHTPATNNGDVKTAGQGNDKGNRDVKHTDKSKHDKKKGGYKELKKAYKELKEDKNAQNKHSKLWDDGKVIALNNYPNLADVIIS